MPEEVKQIKKQWEALSKKYALPQFDDIDKDFLISSLEDTNFPTRDVVERISEKIGFYADLLNELLQPDPANIYSMHETRAFDEAEKKKVYTLYTLLMSYNRRCLEMFLTNNEKSSAEFIISFYKEWQSIKSQLVSFISKMRESWVAEADIKEDLGYLG